MFSANNQFPEVDEGNILAYEGNFLYLFIGNTLKIFEVGPGATLTLTSSFSLPANEISKDVLVYNGIIALIVSYYDEGPYVKSYLKYVD